MELNYNEINKRTPVEGKTPVTQDEAKKILRNYGCIIVPDNHLSVNSKKDSGKNKEFPRESTESM